MEALVPRCLAPFIIAGLTLPSFCPATSAANDKTPFADAVAVWHMADARDLAGANSVLKVEGLVKLGIELLQSTRSIAPRT